MPRDDPAEGVLNKGSSPTSDPSDPCNALRERLREAIAKCKAAGTSPDRAAFELQAKDLEKQLQDGGCNKNKITPAADFGVDVEMLDT